MHQQINQFQKMYLDKEKKAEIFGKYGKGVTDTGSRRGTNRTVHLSHLSPDRARQGKPQGLRDHSFTDSARW